MDALEREGIEAALKGDQEAFEMIITRYSRLLFAHAYSILRQPEEAEDVVQESLLKAYQSKWKVRDPEKFPQWLITIARHRSLDLVRKRRTVPLSEKEHDVIDETVSNPNRHMEAGEIRDKIHGVLATLPESHRIAVTLRFLEGMDYESIQKTMGLTNGALRGILGRAMQTLRVELKSIRT
jgi:RNA polymerase sigma-70 factor, ECF subfamily